MPSPLSREQVADCQVEGDLAAWVYLDAVNAQAVMACVRCLQVKRRDWDSEFDGSGVRKGVGRLYHYHVAPQRNHKLQLNRSSGCHELTEVSRECLL